MDLIKLSKEKKFISKDNLVTINSDYFYLWMCELQKWLREVHNIDIIITSNLLGYGYLLYNRYPPKNITNSNTYQTYEQALEEGLQTALNLIK